VNARLAFFLRWLAKLAGLLAPGAFVIACLPAKRMLVDSGGAAGFVLGNIIVIGAIFVNVTVRVLTGRDLFEELLWEKLP
jgi:hypothetical protein